MKLRFFRNIVPVTLAAVVGFSSVACMNDLDQSIKDPQTNTELDVTGLLAKVYGSLVLTGQIGGDGNPDMSQFDEGNSAFYRRIFEGNELCSDECIWTWQGDASIPEITDISWNSSHGYNELTYYRLMYNVTLCNFYLEETAGSNDPQVLQNRAEVRFMRALYNYYFIDLYGKAPYKTIVDETLPVQKSREEMFAIVVQELEDIINGTSGEELLDYAGDNSNYGRADKQAAKMLLARLYLNAQVYIGEEKWEEAIKYATEVISSEYYHLNTTALNGYTAYEQLFMGDNGENPNARQEIIFPIRCDGATSRSYGGSVYTIASTTGSGSPDQGLPSSQWTCNRAREAMMLKFFNAAADAPVDADMPTIRLAAHDDRAMFFSASRVFDTAEKTTFTSGFSILKWNNTYAQGGTPSDVSFSDTDIPFFRLAEAYLTRAEANMRVGNTDDAKKDINTIRSRAHAQPIENVSLQTMIDEWCREFYFEGRRRSDLIRFGMFTSSTYIWDWKGGSYTGNAVDEKFNLYPIPAAEISSNKNMTQNPGY